jgi:hypothetical protein
VMASGLRLVDGPIEAGAGAEGRERELPRPPFSITHKPCSSCGLPSATWRDAHSPHLAMACTALIEPTGIVACRTRVVLERDALRAELASLRNAPTTI